MAVIGWTLKNTDKLERIIHQQLATQDRFEMTGPAFQAGSFFEPINLNPNMLMGKDSAAALPPEDERTQMQVLRKFCERLGFVSVEICPWNPQNLLFTRLKKEE